jgi:hypothetical protein
MPARSYTRKYQTWLLAAKETYNMEKETYNMAKETYNMAKETYSICQVSDVAISMRAAYGVRQKRLMIYITMRTYTHIYT